MIHTDGDPTIAWGPLEGYRPDELTVTSKDGLSLTPVEADELFAKSDVELQDEIVARLIVLAVRNDENVGDVVDRLHTQYAEFAQAIAA